MKIELSVLYPGVCRKYLQSFNACASRNALKQSLIPVQIDALNKCSVQTVHIKERKLIITSSDSCRIRIFRKFIISGNHIIDLTVIISCI